MCMHGKSKKGSSKKINIGDIFIGFSMCFDNTQYYRSVFNNTHHIWTK